jgi:hypothetical protein
MPAQKKNPLNLNPLQLKTLTLFQALAHLPDHAQTGPEPGTVLIGNIPHAHGDHFHVGNAAVAAGDATGLGNPAVWVVLERKGLIKSGFPYQALMTAEGLAYDTGLGDKILHGAEH